MILKSYCRGDSRIARFKRKSPHYATICHSERRSACPTADRSRSFVEGVSRRRRSDTKPRSECDDGIWLRVLVTFELM